MKNNLQKIPLILSILFLSVCFVVFYFLNKEINLNKTTIEQNEEKWQQETNNRQNTRLLNDSIKKIQPQKELLDTHFVSISDIVPFLGVIESIGADAKVNVKVASVDVPRENDGLVLGVNASGGFEEIYKFILLLENSPYELDIISLAMQKQDAVDSFGKNIKEQQWDASFRIKLLSFTQ